MRTLKLLALVMVVAIVAQAFGAVPAPVRAAGETITIVSDSPISAGAVALGQAISNGTKLAVDQLKKPLEDMGFVVKYQQFDDQGKAEVGVSNAQTIVNDKSILGLVGHLNSGVAIPSSEVYNKSDLVMISPANTATTVTDRGLPTVNRVCGRDDSQGAAGANYAVNELKVKSVYIVNDKTAYGEGVATSFRDTIQTLGVDVQGFEGTEEQSNFDAILTPVLAQNPDLLYWGGLYNNGGAALVKQARAKGYKGFFMGADGLDSTDMAKIAGDSVIGVIFTTTAGPASLFPDAKKFIADYKAAFNTDPQPYAAESYASAQILINAIVTAAKAANGLPTRKDVAAAVRATKDFPTIIGKITFDANGDPTVANYYIWKVGSSDPAVWDDGKVNQIVNVSTAPSPLTAKAAATPAATAAK